MRTISNASGVGAAAVIIYGNDEEITSMALFNQINTGIVPSLFVSKTVGDALVARLVAGEEIMGHLLIDVTYEMRSSDNVIATSRTGMLYSRPLLLKRHSCLRVCRESG